MNKRFFLLSILIVLMQLATAADSTWIRINQLGYLPDSKKNAVLGSKSNLPYQSFYLIDAVSGKTVFTASVGKAFGKYGPFKQTYRLNFSTFTKPGKYYLKAGNTYSPKFYINNQVYDGAADFCLQYMRQQRSGFNPFLQDSCHTHDGYTMYGSTAGLKDSTHIDATGGWHDASDYLQYSSTSANAVYHLLMAYRDHPKVFTDHYQWNGLAGKNGKADVLDEAKWGLDWLVKMHPKKDWLFNQLGDDRDHKSMRIPKEDPYYGKGLERPVYYIDGEIQQRGKFKNNTTGTSSTAAKFSSAFTLAAKLIPSNAALYNEKAKTALDFAYRKEGVTQTVSVLSPYIYAEDNWVDDMELAEAMHAEEAGIASLQKAVDYAKREPLTPWLGKDTAAHYQWYPFINIGHYELAKKLIGKQRDTVIQLYKTGIELVEHKASKNAFYRGIPFIWCSNNLTVAFAMQCGWYSKLSGNHRFDELMQANIDWLFGCNPWGTSMVYGLPVLGDSPADPHSAFTHLKNYPINGGLVDGPVYTSIYKNLIGIKLFSEDEYAPFQSDLAVYHDDYGDYSTNEPTMDGTASLIYLLAAQQASAKKAPMPVKINHIKVEKQQGAIVRAMPVGSKVVSLVFTADEFGEGLPLITKILKQQKVAAGFFFTGRFYRNKSHQKNIQQLQKDAHYLGPHSDAHLLYCDWKQRDSLLVNYQQFSDDLNKNLSAMEHAGVVTQQVHCFIPPYEWWNDSVATWASWRGMQLCSFTPGTFTNADYTWPEMGKAYRSSSELLNKIKALANNTHQFNGSILLVHAGTDPRRKDKLYKHLSEIIQLLKKQGYTFKRVDELVK